MACKKGFAAADILDTQVEKNLFARHGDAGFHDVNAQYDIWQPSGAQHQSVADIWRHALFVTSMTLWQLWLEPEISNMLTICCLATSQHYNATAVHSS